MGGVTISSQLSAIHTDKRYRAILASRWLRAGLLCLLAALLSLPLIDLHVTTSPVTLERTEGEAQIFFAANRNRVLFPGECLTLTWKVEGIKAVFLNGQDRIGYGEQERCLVNTAPTLTVIHRDDSRHDYRLPVERLYMNPLVAVSLVVITLLLATSAYTLRGPRGALVVISLAVFAPMLRSLANLNNDFIDHTMFAAIARDTGDIRVLPPHLLYHGTIIGLNRLLPELNLENAGYLLITAAYVLCTLSVYRLLRRMNPDTFTTKLAELVFMAVTLGLMLNGPITFISQQFNRFPGVIEFTVHYSPTMGLLRPFAVTLFLGLIAALDSPRGGRDITMLAVLVVLATLAKPSYTAALAPAAGLTLVYLAWQSRVQNRRAQIGVLLGGILVPAALVLGWQYWFLYGPNAISDVYASADKAQILFAPMEYITVWNGTPLAWVIPDLLFSILFPLVVYLAYFRQAKQDVALNLAWLVLLVGLLPMYLLVEMPNPGHGNLTWSGQISLFVLFVVSAGFLLRQNTQPVFGTERFKPDWRLLICAGVFMVHLVNHLADLI